MYNKLDMIDEDLIRIKSKIDALNNLLKYGTSGLLVNLIVSYFVTLEITNSVEKLTIQDIHIILKQKINEINSHFEELWYIAKNTDDLSLIESEKCKFQTRAYQIFNLDEIFGVLISKCVTFGYGLNRLVHNDNLLEVYTKSLVDSMLFVDTHDVFEQRLLMYVNERVDSVADPIKRKQTKLTILQNLMDRVNASDIAIPVDKTKLDTPKLDSESTPKADIPKLEPLEYYTIIDIPKLDIKSDTISDTISDTKSEIQTINISEIDNILGNDSGNDLGNDLGNNLGNIFGGLSYMNPFIKLSTEQSETPNINGNISDNA